MVDSPCFVHEKYKELSILTRDSGAQNFTYEAEIIPIRSPGINYILHVCKLSLRFSYRKCIQFQNSSRAVYAQISYLNYIGVPIMWQDVCTDIPM